MTADDRLDQLEILLSESMTILDRHTAQLKQLSNAVSQLGTSVSQLSTLAVHQSDNISFLLNEQAEMRAEQAEIRAEQAIMQTGMVGIDSKIDQILQLLQKPGQ